MVGFFPQQIIILLSVQQSNTMDYFEILLPIHQLNIRQSNIHHSFKIAFAHPNSYYHLVYIFQQLNFSTHRKFLPCRNMPIDLHTFYIYGCQTNLSIQIYDDIDDTNNRETIISSLEDLGIIYSPNHSLTCMHAFFNCTKDFRDTSFLSS